MLKKPNLEKNEITVCFHEFFLHILVVPEKNILEVVYDKFYIMDPVDSRALVAHSSILIN